MSTKVETIIIDNVKAISHQEAQLGGYSAYVIGRNGGGKTTFISFLIKRLQGLKPDVILKQGTTEGYAFIKLTTGEQFEWKINPEKKGDLSEIKFTTKDGIKVPVTTAIAERFFPVGFNIDKFLAGTPKVQQKILEGLSGIDLDDVTSRYDIAYTDRTNQNREVKRCEALLTPVNSALPIVEIPIMEIQQEIADIGLHNHKYDNSAKGVTDLEKQLIADETEIKRLKTLLATAEANKKTTEKRISDGNKWLAIPANKRKGDNELQALETKLQETIDKNKSIIENNKAIEAKKAFDLLKADADKADEKVKAIEKEKSDLIRTAKLPAGFGFEAQGDGIIYNGLPFTKEQQALSNIYIATLKLAFLNMGECRMIHFEGSALDPDNLDTVVKWANENDLQIIIELPRRGEVEYQIIDNTAL